MRPAVTMQFVSVLRVFPLKMLMFVTALVMGSTLSAQEPVTPAEPPPPAETATQLDTIEVTGSRIRSLTADSPSPIQVLTSRDIERSGVTNIQELLLKIPAMGAPALSRTNSNFLTSSAGVATIDLRGLGTDRTLVLVNGRRFVSGIPGSAGVDLNTIPTDFIDRVEIFTGGASAVYGSDAMAGVVNIILKRNAQGLTADFQKGESAKGDDKKEKFSLTGGLTSADGRGDVITHFGYSSQGIVRGMDRAGNEIDNIPLAFLTGDIADIFTFQTPFLSSFAPQGRIFTTGGSRTFDANNNIIPVSTNGADTNGDGLGDGPGATGFNRQAFRTLAVPTERYLFATSGELRFVDDHAAFFEGTYNQTQTRSALEPFPMDSADGTGGLYPASGVGPAEFDVGGVTMANPLIPAGLLALMTDTDGDGFRDYSFSRRLAEVGNRGNTADRDTFRVLAGLKGEVLDLWNYEVFTAYGSTKESQVSSGQVNVLNFRNAMEAVPDVNDVDNDGDTTDAVCRDANARAQGCVAANIFGFNTLTPEMVRYITAPGLLATFTEQRMVGGTTSGNVVDLPAGPLGLAVGGEYRVEFSRSEFDPLQQAGLNAGNAIPRTEGQFNVTEYFAEVRVPILAGLPFVDSLTATAALRLGDYSTVGNVVSYTGGLDWAATKDIRARTTVSRSTRAPNIGELFSPPSQNFPTILDPCAGVTENDTSTLGQRCLADPGVLANVQANPDTLDGDGDGNTTEGIFTLNQADLQGTSGFDRGNPDVEEEVGDSFTLGLVWQPSNIDILKDMSFEVDYFDIQIDDAIVSTPRQFLLDQCFGGGDQSFCSFVTRRPADVGANSAGSISRVDTSVSNSGGLEASGYDMTVDWAGAVGPGRLSTQLRYSHLIRGAVIPLPGADADPFDGEVGSAKDKAALQVGFEAGRWSVRMLGTHIAKSYLDDQFLAGFDAAPESVSVPAETYFDVQAGFKWMAATFYVGVDNLFDAKPPRFDTNGLITGGTTGTGTASGVYDAIGQRAYAGVRVEM